MYVINHNLVIPLVFALMSDKKQSSYESSFSSIITHNINLNSKIIMTNFEQSTLNAFKIQFSNTEQDGSFFPSNTTCLAKNLNYFWNGRKV